MSTAAAVAPIPTPSEAISGWRSHRSMLTPAAKTAGHIRLPQRMQAAAAMPPANNGSVGCAPTLGSMKPTAPAAKMAANVATT